MIFMVGNDGRRLYIYDVHVAGCDEVDQVDVLAHSDAEALKLATAEADELYINYTLRLAGVV